MPEAPRRHRSTRTIAMMALACILSTVLVTPIAATPAQAAVTCTPPSPRPNGEGAGRVYNPGGTRPLRAAPYGVCGVVANVRHGTIIFHHCWVLNDYINFWVYGRVSGTSTYGWMFLENMYDLAYDDDFDGTVERGWCG